MRWPWQKAPPPPPPPQIQVSDLWFSIFTSAMACPVPPKRPDGEVMNPADVADWGVREFSKRFVEGPDE